MVLGIDPDDSRFTPSQASVLLTLALTEILGGSLRGVIQDEAVNYLAAWGHEVTKKDRARVRLLEEDEGGKLFRYITDTLMTTESVIMDIRQIAKTVHDVPAHDFDRFLNHEDMVAIEAIISAESRRRQNEKVGDAQSLTHGRDESPYC